MAVEGLLRVEDVPDVVYEPACGDGAIVKVLRETGKTVLASDLYDYGCPESFAGVDYLQSSASGVPAIVTNPPYRHAAEFIRKAITESPYVAMLLRLQFLEGQRRRDILDKLSRVWVFSKRLPRMHRQGWSGPITTSALAFAWFVWDASHEGHPRLGWI